MKISLVIVPMLARFGFHGNGGAALLVIALGAVALVWILDAAGNRGRNDK